MNFWTYAARLTGSGFKEILSIKDKLNRIMSEHTGQPLERLENDTDRDNFMSADEAAA